MKRNSCMEGHLPDLLGRSEGEQAEKVDDQGDLHCRAYQMMASAIGAVNCVRSGRTLAVAGLKPL